MSEFIGVNKAAALAGLSPDTIYKYVWRGLMPPTVSVEGSKSRVLVWRREDIERWNRERRRVGRPRHHQK